MYTVNASGTDAIIERAGGGRSVGGGEKGGRMGLGNFDVLSLEHSCSTSELRTDPAVQEEKKVGRGGGKAWGVALACDRGSLESHCCSSDCCSMRALGTVSVSPGNTGTSLSAHHWLPVLCRMLRRTSSAIKARRRRPLQWYLRLQLRYR